MEVSLSVQMCQSFCIRSAEREHWPNSPNERTPERMKRRVTGLRLLGAKVAIPLVLALGCMPVPPHPRIDSLEEGFSGRLARAHSESLEGLYPRFPGSRSDKIARVYLAREFRRVGAKTRVLEEGDQRHLIAELEGASDDILLLVAAYPALESGVWIDDSGAALLLEFARVLGAARPPYTLIFALAETRPPSILLPENSAEADSDWQTVASPAAARGRLLEAGRGLAGAIEAEGVASRVRAVIVFDTSADAGLSVALDLRSHPEFRRLFWESAGGLGYASMFPPDANWASPDSLHLGFKEHSMDRVVALVHVEEDHSDLMQTRTEDPVSAEMFESVGIVTLEALSQLMGRFEKVDAFSR